MKITLMDSGQNTPLWLVRAKKLPVLSCLSSKPIIPDGCSGNFTAASGTITSPGYPNSYENNTSCIYTISTTPGNNIVLNILSMDIEFGDFESNPDYYYYDYDQYIDWGRKGATGFEGNICWDYLEVRDGASEQSPLLGVYCGHDISLPIEIRSSQNNLWMK